MEARTLNDGINYQIAMQQDIIAYMQSEINARIENGEATKTAMLNLERQKRKLNKMIKNNS